MTLDQTMGCDRVCVHHQLNLPRNSQDLSVRNAQARNRLMGLWARDRNLRRTANEPDCGATIHSWYGVFDYSGCRAVRMDRGRGNAALILSLQILRHLRDRQIHGDVA
jgi:hypothetical protein